MENYEQQIAFSHLLLEVSKELIAATPETISDIVEKSLYEIGELLMAKGIKVQLFNDKEDAMDDDVFGWTVFGEPIQVTPLNEDLMLFFMDHDPVIEAGEVVTCFKEGPFEAPAMVYPMMVHSQPIGFVMVELMAEGDMMTTKKLVRHATEIFNMAFERMQRDVMIFEHVSISAATLESIDLGIVALNDSGHIELINRACELMFDMNPLTTVGQRLDQAFGIVNKTYDMAIDTFILEMVETQDFLPISDPLQMTAGQVSKDVYMKITPKYDTDQMYQGVVLVLTLANPE